MKKLLLLSCLFAFVASLRAETISLGPYGRLSFVLDPAWKVRVEDMGDTFDVVLTPTRTTVNARAALKVVLNPGTDTNSKAKLRTRIVEGHADLAADSVEGRVVPRELFVKTGFGFYADFTDPKLVGRPPVKGDFKVITVAMIRLSDEIGIIAEITSDGFRETPHLQLLAAIETLEMLPAAPAAPVAPGVKK